MIKVQLPGMEIDLQIGSKYQRLWNHYRSCEVVKMDFIESKPCWVGLLRRKIEDNQEQSVIIFNMISVIKLDEL